MDDSCVHFLGCRIHKYLFIVKNAYPQQAHDLILKTCIHLLVKNAVSILSISTTYLQNTRLPENCTCCSSKHNVKTKEIVEKQWERKRKKGKPCYKIVQVNPTKLHELRLGNLPEEVPTRVIQSYLSKYLISPEVRLERIEFEDGLMIENGEATVTYKGIRRPIPRKPWVGPGVTAMVLSKTTTHIPWDRYKQLCSQCKGEGHKAWECEKNKTCYRCKETHLAADCPYCHMGREYGHKTTNKCGKKESTQDASRMEQANQQDRPPKKKDQQTSSQSKDTTPKKPKETNTSVKGEPAVSKTTTTKVNKDTARESGWQQ